MSATPRPWKAHENKIYVGESINEADQVIAILDSADAELARLIVRAVNTFDEAKAAIEEAYHELRIRCGYKPGDHCYDALKAVLAKMEVEA